MAVAAPHIVRVPHARGNEPVVEADFAGGTSVFPTPVGMNRNLGPEQGRRNRVPHARGNEPAAGEAR